MKGGQIVGRVRHSHHDPQGSGIVNTLINKIPSSDSTARPRYPGERHTVLQLKNGLPGIANYMG